MNTTTKNRILGMIYGILTFLIFLEILNMIGMKIVNVLYHPIGDYVISSIPSAISTISAIVLSLLITYFILKYLRINRLNQFFKPNKFKVITTFCLVIVAFGLIILRSANILEYSYVIEDILLFYGGRFDFDVTRFLFPILIYYIITCTIYYFKQRNSLKPTQDEITTQQV